MTGSISWFEKMAFLAAHPKGAIFWTEEPENPGDRYGGTWTLRTAGRFLIPACAPDAEDQTYAVGNIGGASTAKLSTANLPASGARISVANESTGDTTLSESSVLFRSGGKTTSATGGLRTDALGSGTAFSIMPLWIAMYCWQRTA